MDWLVDPGLYRLYLHVRRCCITQSRIFRCDKWDCPVSRVHYARYWSGNLHIALLFIDGRRLSGWWLGLYRTLDSLTGHDRPWNHPSSASVVVMKVETETALKTVTNLTTR